ncbi:spermatogenesis-associated protein 31G1 [Macrotis lagotis]|uniref:spermatogenesis-associated protein 31G1 n=1 Tax=Macrotis lagotis TaxID=92651 RepID=UPI003D682C19
MEWLRMLSAKAQIGLIWGEIKETLLLLGCPQCGCSCPQSPGNLLILLLFLIWQFRRKYHGWHPAKHDEIQSTKVPERAQEQSQSWKGVLFQKVEEEEEKEEDLLRHMRLDPWWCFQPRKMEAKRKTSFFQTEALRTRNEEMRNLHPSFWGPHGTNQSFGNSKGFTSKTAILEMTSNSYDLHNSTDLIQVPTSLSPLSTSSVKAKGNTQLFWGLPSLHSESLGSTFPKSDYTFPSGVTNQQLPSDTPLIFFNELSYLPPPNLLVKVVSLPATCLPSIFPLPVLHGNGKAIEMASPELSNEPEIQLWASTSQDPILDPLLPLLSSPHSTVNLQGADFMDVTKVMASDEHEDHGPRVVQQSDLPCIPKSLAQPPRPPSVPLTESQGTTGPTEESKLIVTGALWQTIPIPIPQWQTQLPQDSDPSGPSLNPSPHLLNKHQGNDLTESPRVTTLWIPHVPEVPWCNMQEKKPSCPSGPQAPVLDMSSQMELQGTDSLEVPSWDNMQTHLPWTPFLPSFPKAELQGANSEETPVPLARPKVTGWGVQQIHLPCNPPLEPPSQTWSTPLRVPTEIQKEHHPQGSLIGHRPSMSRIVTSMSQEEGAIGEAPFHTQRILDPDTESCPWNKEPRILCSPSPHSLDPRSPFLDLLFPRTPIQDFCPPTTSSCLPAFQVPITIPAFQGTMEALSFNSAHIQAKKVMSQDAQPLTCHSPDPQLLLQEQPAGKGREVPLMPPHSPHLDTTKIPERQSLSQSNTTAGHQRAKLQGSEKSEPSTPGKSQAKATVLTRKRKHTRKPRVQGGGDAGLGVSPVKGKTHSSESKKLTNCPPARRSLMSPQQGVRDCRNTSSQPEQHQSSTKTEAFQVLPPKGQGQVVMTGQTPHTIRTILKGTGGQGGRQGKGAHLVPPAQLRGVFRSFWEGY